MEVKFFLFSVGDSRGHMFLGVGNLGAHLRFRLPQFVTIQIKLGFFFFFHCEVSQKHMQTWVQVVCLGGGPG